MGDKKEVVIIEVETNKDPFASDMWRVSNQVYDAINAGKEIKFVAKESEPEPKKNVIRLADLPNGTVIKYFGPLGEDYPAYCVDGKLYDEKYSTGQYGCPIMGISDCATKFELPQGDWLPWFGDECPWPGGVMAEIDYIGCATKQRYKRVDLAQCIDWDSDVTAHRCIGLADGYELEA